MNVKLLLFVRYPFLIYIQLRQIQIAKALKE